MRDFFLTKRNYIFFNEHSVEIVQFYQSVREVSFKINFRSGAVFVRIRILIKVLAPTGSGSTTLVARTEVKMSHYNQCCGSGMFIPDPDFYPSRIPDPRSRIPDPGSKNSNKREG
jgi:hypothetical protein